MPLPSSRKGGTSRRQADASWVFEISLELPKSLVGNGFKPFPTDVRRNKPAPCLTRGRVKETRQVGVFQQPVGVVYKITISSTYFTQSDP